MTLRDELETRLELLKEFFQHWNLIDDLKALFCTNCISTIQKDIAQFRKNGTVDTEIDPNDDQLLKNVITITDLEKLDIEPITSFEQLFDIKAEIQNANIKMEQYWEAVIIKREAKRKKSIVDAVKYNIEMEIRSRNHAAMVIQQLFKLRNRHMNEPTKESEISSSPSPSQSKSLSPSYKASKKVVPYSPEHQISPNRIISKRYKKNKVFDDFTVKSNEKNEGSIDKCVNVGCI